MNLLWDVLQSNIDSEEVGKGKNETRLTMILFKFNDGSKKAHYITKKRKEHTIQKAHLA